MSDQQSRPRRWIGFVAGVAAGLGLALALYLLAQKLQPESGMLLVSVLLIPVAACALATWIGVPPGRNAGAEMIAITAMVTTALLLCSAVVLREGVICLAMATPIFYPIGMLGGAIVVWLRGHSKNRTPPALVIIAPLLLMPIEQQSAYPTMQTSVVTTIEIDAPIEAVWREAVEIRDIADAEQSWTFTQDVLQIPRPLDAQLVERDGQRVRAATWRGGVRFYEVVEEWRPQRSVSWRFEIPEATADRLLDRHLRLDEDYLKLQGGRYDLTALSANRTRLTLTTSYAARTPFNAYARAWGELLLGDIHRNVLGIVQARAKAMPTKSQ